MTNKKTMKKCKICGQVFTRLNMNHIRKHGFNSKEEYEAAVVKKQEIGEELLSDVSRAILAGDDLEPDQLNKLNKIEQVQANRVTQLLQVASLRRTARLGRLYDALDRTEELIVKEDEMKKYSLDQLLRVGKYFGTSAADLLKELSHDDDVVPTILNNNGGLVVQQAPGHLPGVPEDPRERSALMQQASNLLAADSEPVKDPSSHVKLDG